jgi:CubicO group peptidase (beta-lactamase class C family)
MSADDDLMAGFPPEYESAVSLANWQDPPFNRWSFKHLREVIPTQRIARGPTARELPRHEDPPPVADVAVTRLGSGESTFAAVIEDTWTDAVLVMHEGDLVVERYSADMEPQTSHLLMSVSKSIVGCVAGVLAAHGRLDTESAVGDYVPEIKGSGYAGARVRDLLDMRTGVKFSEAYKDPDAEVRVIERHMGWRPLDDESTRGMYAYLATLGSDGPHGGNFVYRSADTDMLGWVCERAAGARMAELVSDLIWAPMGAEFDAEVTCDALGTAVHDGGICATARDLARFGQMLLDHGRVGDSQVVPEEWLAKSWRIDSDIRHAFAASDSEPVLPGGWYRNQFWFTPGPSGDVLLCLGIHGQMVLVDRATRTVGVKLSSWPEPQDVAYLVDTIRAFTAVGRHLSGLAEVTDSRRSHTGPSGLVEGRSRGQA